MPMYKISCECGCTEGMSTIAEREAHDKMVPCFDCDKLNTTQISPPALHGMTWPGGKHFGQLGRSFESVKEMETWASANGFEPVSNESKRWNDLKNNSKQLNDDEAKAQGFRNADDRRTTTRTQANELLERNQTNAAKEAEAAPAPAAPIVKNITSLA